MVKGFVDWLEDELIKREWSRADLARKAGITESSLSLIYSGNRKPGAKLCKAIANALKIPPDVIYRKAGLLPADIDDDEHILEIKHLYHMLDETNREELIEDARLRLKRQDINKAKNDQRRTGRSTTSS